MRQKFHIDFVKKSKIFFCISLGIMLVSLVLNIFVFPTLVDIQFTGGTIIKYSYGGDLKAKDIEKTANEAIGTIESLAKDKLTYSYSDNLASSNANDKHIVSMQFTGNKAVSVEDKQVITNALQEAYPDNNIKEASSSSVDASKGANFFFKCLAAVLIAAVLMIFYVAIRFKKIGGLSAGVMAVVALIHDLILVYFVFVLFRMPLNDNFIAVVLMILGYSLNDTIVIYDRIRENRRKSGPKVSTAEVVNASLNQCLVRTICTSVTTIFAIGSVLVVSLIYNIDSIVSFALPMMIGLVSGSYSSLCIAAPLWVMWKNHKDKKRAEAKQNSAKEKAAKKSKKSDSKKNENAKVKEKTEKTEEAKAEADTDTADGEPAAE